jgi:hypothetical protein
MTTEELSFILQGFFNRDVLIDLLLRPALDPEVAEFKRVQLALQDLNCVCSFIHQVDFGDDTDRAVTIRVDFTSNLECV